MITTKLMFGLAAALTTSGALLLAAGPAAARDVTVVAAIENDVPVARVSFADLDLTGQPGQRTLRHRVTGAIHTVCEPALMGEPVAYSFCQGSAWAEARPQMAAAIARAGRLAAGNATAQDRALAFNSIRLGAH